MGYANFANDIGKVTIFRVSWDLFEANRTYTLAMSYSKRYFSFVANASEN